MAKRGVLLVAFGGPDCLDAVGPFMCSLMGREAPEAAVASAKVRYLAIGGASPLPAIAERMAAQLERELSGMPRAAEAEIDAAEGVGAAFVSPPGLRAPGEVRVPVRVGMRYTAPTIERAVAELNGMGCREAVWVSLSPFEAAVTTGAYEEAVEAAVAAFPGMRAVAAARYNRSDGFVGFLADEVVDLTHEADILKNRTLVVFTAHSLPVADIEADPSYVDQLRETASAVAAGAGLGEASGFDALPGIEAFGGPGVAAPWLLAFQSKGRTPGDWVGPDLDDVIDAAAAEGFATLIVCPVGFATDHMETLYDLDVLAADRALLAEMEWYRGRVPNDDPRMIGALAESVRKVL